MTTKDRPNRLPRVLRHKATIEYVFDDDRTIRVTCEPSEVTLAFTDKSGHVFVLSGIDATRETWVLPDGTEVSTDD